MTQPTVLITGANRGIGYALSRKYMSEGYHVLATCPNLNDSADLQALAKASPLVEVYELDVTDEDSRKHLIKVLEGHQIDVLINNAGIVSGDPDITCNLELDPSQIFGTIDESAWEDVFLTNTIAPAMVTQDLLPNLRKSQSPKIIMISSRTGSITELLDPNFIAYSSSKAALNATTKNIATHLHGENFSVVSLNPGWVRTQMGGEEEANLTPKESADKLFKVIENLTPKQNGKFISYTGETLAW